MTFKYNSAAAEVLNNHLPELVAYEIKVDDPLLSALKKECVLTACDVEVIQNHSDSYMKMDVLVECLKPHVTRELFVIFVECVGSIMKMPELQQKLLNEVEERLILGHNLSNSTYFI